MKIRSNPIMDNYLSNLGYHFINFPISLPQRILEIVESPFIIKNDCTILAALYGNKHFPKSHTDIQKCEWEYHITHFHPDSYIDTKNEIEYLKLALECANRIAIRLNTSFPDKSFRILVSFSETTLENGEIETYGSGTVRFYQIREGCENVMRTNDLNDFMLDAVLEIETDANRQ